MSQFQVEPTALGVHDSSLCLQQQENCVCNRGSRHHRAHRHLNQAQQFFTNICKLQPAGMYWAVGGMMLKD
jgi:hypothetical protein